MPTIRDFLTSVLPEQSGNIAIGYGPEGPNNTRFVRTVDQIINLIPGAIRAGINYYFTPAVYEAKSRKARACLAKRCIAFDIDLHSSKADVETYDTVDEAWRAMLIACMKMQIPAPSWVVHTGRGLHVYWALTSDISPTDWVSVTTRMKAALRATDRKLAADTTRVADLAGYLRLPGTINTAADRLADFFSVKGRHAGTETSYDFSLFGKLPAASAAATGSGTALIPGKRPPTARINRNGSARASAEAAEDTSIPRPLSLLQECAPLMRLATQPDLQSYEAWQGIARLMVRADNPDEGLKAYHVLSSGHPGYDPEQTDRKFEDALRTSFASPSCAQMREWAGLSTSACASCPLYQAQGKNGKPAALQSEFIDPVQNRNIAPGTLDAEVEMLARARVSRASGRFAPLDVLGLTIPKRLLKEPAEDQTGVWIDRDSGAMIARIETRTPKGDVVYEDRRIARRPFWVDRRTAEVDLAQGGVVFGARFIQVRKEPNDTWSARYVTMRAKELNAGPSAVLSAMNSYGLDIAAIDARSAAVRQVLTAVLRQVQQDDSASALTKESNFGWRDLDDPEHRAFVIGDRRYMKGGTTALIEQEQGAQAMNDKVSQCGSLDQAIAIARRAMAGGTPTLKFIMLCALGAPLLHMTNVEGALVLLSGATGRGKSAALSYANSFFGSSKPGKLLATGSDTQKSIMHMIGVLSNLPAFIDETTLMKSEDIAAMLLQITQGGENNRMEASTNRLRARNRWQTIAIASANTSIADIITSGDYAAEAQAMRVIDLHFESLTEELFYYRGADAFLDEVLVPSHQHHGLIGVAFIKYVLEHYDEVRKLVVETERKLRKADTALSSAAGDAFRVWRAVAVVCAVAGKISEHLGFWTMDRGLMDHIIGVLSNNAEKMKARADAESGTYINNFLFDHQDSILIETVRDASGQEVSLDRNGKHAALPPAHVPLRRIVARLTLTEGKTDAECWVSANAFRKYCRGAGLSFGYVVQKMQERGLVLEVEGTRPIAHGASLPSASDSASTIGGEALPGATALVVRLKLIRPYVIGEPPEYAI